MNSTVFLCILLRLCLLLRTQKSFIGYVFLHCSSAYTQIFTKEKPLCLSAQRLFYLLIAGSAAGSVALAAIDRSVVLRDEMHAGRSATLRAGGLVHFALLSLASSRAAVLAGDAAGLAAGRLVLEALLRVELLLTSGEHKFLATVSAGQSLVLIHGIFPSEKNRDKSV